MPAHRNKTTTEKSIMPGRILSAIKAATIPNRQRFNPDLQIEGILFTMDNCRYNNAKRNKQAIKTTYGSDIKIFEQTIPRTESLAETASEGVSIFAYDGKSKGADSYLELVQEVLKHA